MTAAPGRRDPGPHPPSNAKGTTMARHPLASPGSWVDLRDPHDLRYGDKQRVQDVITDTERPLAATNQMRNALIALLVTNWQLPEQLPLPSQDIGVLSRLTIRDGNALENLVKPAQELLFPGTPEPETAEEQAKAVADPASPTPAIDGSSPASMNGQSPATTP